MTSPWLSHYDPEVPSHLVYEDITLCGLLENAAKRNPGHIALSFNGREISYSSLLSQANTLARGLLAQGLASGDRVALIAPNVPEFVAAFFGILRAGGVVTALNPNFTVYELQALMQKARCTWVLVAEDCLSKVRALQLPVPLTHCHVFKQGTLKDSLYYPEKRPDEAPCEADTLDNLMQIGKQESISLPVLSPSQPAVFQFTGGTTGLPRAVVACHSHLIANATQFRTWLTPLKEGEETTLAVLPLYHVYGMVMVLGVGILLRSKVVLIPDARDMPAVIAAIRREQPTFMPGVPAMYYALIRHPEIMRDPSCLASIKACISGSAPLPLEVKLEFERLSGGRLVEGYGLSEAPTATHCNPLKGENRNGSIGLPLPDVDCRLEDLNDGSLHLESDRPGELLIRSPQVMQGYYELPEETCKTLRDGWLHTGDIARMDADGFFYLLGRIKEVIKVSGFQVWPREVEEVILHLEGVSEVAVAGIPHPARGEAVKAWVVRKKSVDISAEEIIAHCRKYLTGYKIPTEVEFRDSLPRSGVGKVLRRVLVEEEEKIKRCSG